MIRRLAYVLLIQAMCFDIWVQATVRGVFYVLLNKSKPSARETISGYYGSAAAEGYWWGVAGARCINWLFRNPEHCASAAATEASVRTAAYD